MTIADLPLPEAGVQSGRMPDRVRMKTMKIGCIIFAAVAAFLLSGMTAASAQDAPVLSVGGRDFAPDSLYQAPSMLFYPAFSAPRLPSLLRPDLPVSREDRAMAGDFAVHSEVMKSVAAYLRQVPLFEITATGARPRFGNPFAIPYGHVPMGNSSNPFVTAMTPGWQPEPYKYSPESIPQCIRLEYDFASGTWKQVMVDWEEYTEQMSGFSENLQTEPVPAVPVTPVERAMRR